MIKNEFLIVDRSVLPPCFEQVVKAVRMTEQEGKSVSTVCKELDISRSTFYKYKDKVFEMPNNFGRKAIISICCEDEKGILSNVLNTVAEFQGSIITINQEMPIHNVAYINITLDAKDLTVSIYELTAKIKSITKVKEVSLLAFE